MNPETITADTGKPLEISDLSVEPTLEPDETVSKKPRESNVYNHGTGYVTFVQALKLITASRATLSRYTNDGKIPFDTDERGRNIYQVVDLERVFGKLKSPDTDETVSEEEGGEQEKPEQPNHETALKLALLEQENRFLKEQNAELRDNAEDWKQQAERAMLMLTHRPEPATAVQPVQPEPEPARRGFLGLFKKAK